MIVCPVCRTVPYVDGWISCECGRLQESNNSWTFSSAAAHGSFVRITQSGKVLLGATPVRPGEEEEVVTEITGRALASSVLES